MGERYWRILATALFILLPVLLQRTFASAQGASSSYRIDESYVGPGGELESGSSNYSVQAGQQTTGNTGVVEGASTNYKTQGGATTTSDPTLRCVVNAASLNLGALSIGATSTATATFSVLNYTSYGYNVSIIGNPPTMGSHSLNGLSSNSASAVGTEQFGVNLVANTSPTVFGAFPVQVPDGTFSFGNATSNYDTPNSYRYVSGETVASAPKSSGQTNYTISYIVNVSTNTPGGTYTGDQAILCTGTY
jgi:hypothetical protein